MHVNFSEAACCELHAVSLMCPYVASYAHIKLNSMA
jgi:hypothetical protein